MFFFFFLNRVYSFGFVLKNKFCGHQKYIYILRSIERYSSDGEARNKTKKRCTLLFTVVARLTAARPARRVRREAFRIPRVESGQIRQSSKPHGSGRITQTRPDPTRPDPTRLRTSRGGHDRNHGSSQEVSTTPRVESDRVGSNQEVFKSHGSVRGRRDSRPDPAKQEPTLSAKSPAYLFSVFQPT